MQSTASQHERFSELLERHRGIVFKVANAYGWHAADREDLAQEIAAQLWRGFPDYDASRPFPTWMYRVALNVAISFRRRESRHIPVEPLDETLHDVADREASHDDAGEAVRVLERFMAELDPLNRALLLLYLDERSQRDIAEILGISETNVSTKIGRLKQRLKNGIAAGTL
jgi:RNA polymerase sigma factor (sigma-70 family)